MTQNSRLKASIITALTLSFSAAPVLASTVPIPANPPKSKCVTASTIASHDSYAARLEKDVAPYSTNANAATAIKTYREGLDIAWEAMGQPYCGDGIYGIAPFIKSYSKSVERERATFIAAVAKLPKDGSAPVAAAQKAQVQVVAAPAPAPAPAAAPAVKPVAVAAKIAAKFIPGMHFGLRSNAVMDLQKFLTARYGIAQDDSSVTGYFGPKTQSLVIKYQLEKKIIASESDAGAGLVGPKTCASLNAQ